MGTKSHSDKLFTIDSCREEENQGPATAAAAATTTRPRSSCLLKGQVPSVPLELSVPTPASPPRFPGLRTCSDTH